MSEEKQMPDEVNTIEDLVKHSLAQDYNKANEVFGTVMTTKLADVLDQTKVKLAGQIYNGDPEDEEIEDEEEIENEEEEVEGETEEETEETEEDNEEIEDEDLEVPEEIEDQEDDIQGAAV